MTFRTAWSPAVTPWTGRLLLAMVGLTVTGPAVFAQDSRLPPKAYLNKGTVHLPIQINDAERPHIQEVQLYVKESPQAPWVLKEKVPGTQTFFTYRAGQDGEYWFNVATLDRTGKMIPADPSKEPPGLIVIIDSTPPQADAQLAGTSPEGQLVRCEVRDANPEPTKTRFFYQTRDQVWRPAEAIGGQTDTYCVPGQAATTGAIRITACDMAGNTTTREFNLSALPTAGTTAAVTPKSGSVVVVEGPMDKIVMAPTAPELVSTAPKAPLPPPFTEKIVTQQERVEIIANKPAPPAPPQNLLIVETTPKTPFALPSGTEARPTPEGNVPAATPEMPAKRHLVNNCHVFLDYQVDQTGVSGVGRVEVWYTRDLGRTWQKLAEDPNRKGQAEVDLPGEGVYGVTMVVANGRGFGANPPQSGDVPDWWIEVDTTRPKAELLNVRSSPTGDDGSLHITWSAKDKNLHSEPIDLFYAVNKQGPWLPIAKNLKNDGLYRWSPAPEIGSHAYVRLTVRDQAGNTASSDSIQPVALDDLSRPRGRVVGITTVPRGVVGSAPGPLMPHGN